LKSWPEHVVTMPKKGTPLEKAARAYAGILQDVLGDDLVSVVLFGSVTRGDAKVDSDVDLVVIARNLPKSQLARADIAIKAETELARLMRRTGTRRQRVMIAAILRTPEEASHPIPLYLDMVDEAIILFDRDRFFTNVLSKLRKKLQSLGARRAVVGNIRYWDLKPDYKPGDVIEFG